MPAKSAEKNFSCPGMYSPDLISRLVESGLVEGKKPRVTLTELSDQGRRVDCPVFGDGPGPICGRVPNKTRSDLEIKARECGPQTTGRVPGSRR